VRRTKGGLIKEKKMEASSPPPKNRPKNEGTHTKPWRREKTVGDCIKPKHRMEEFYKKITRKKSKAQKKKEEHLLRSSMEARNGIILRAKTAREHSKPVQGVVGVCGYSHALRTSSFEAKFASEAFFPWEL